MKLNIEEIDMLLEFLENSELRAKVQDAKITGALEMSTAEKDQLVDKLGDILLEKGIGEDQEINSFGKCLDTLIGKLTY